MIGSWGVMEGWWEEGMSVPKCLSVPLYKVGSLLLWASWPGRVKGLGIGSE